jgi:hypothetical protein
MHTALRYYMQCTLIFDNTGIFSKQDEEILNAFLGTLAPLLQSSKLFRRSVLQTNCKHWYKQPSVVYESAQRGAVPYVHSLY